MKFLLISVGSRGDMEPILSMGDLLQKRGHAVTCLMPEQYKYLAEESRLSFESLGPEFLDLIEGDLGTAIMGGEMSLIKKINVYVGIIKAQKPIQKKLLEIQQEVVRRIKPDRIISNGKAIYPIFWEKENPNKTLINIPVPFLHYVKQHSHVAFHSNYGELINKWTYWLANIGLRKTAWAHRNRLQYKHISKGDIKRIIEHRKYIYTVSPQLFERPSYWPDNLTVLGYHERDKKRQWQATEELTTFLKKHPKPILITFGSMINANPEEKMKIIYAVLKKNQIPAIVNTAGGGLPQLADYDKNLVHFVKRIPYDRIFPKLHAVVHHGGSGTTHAAVKYGCASMIIPHIIDQYAWNNIIHALGVGPLGPKISKLSIASFEKSLLDLYHNADYKTMAEKIGKRMQQENYSDALYQKLTAHVDDNL